MEIIVYTKPGCGPCSSFKDKLRKHLKVVFAERDLVGTMALSDTWREDKIAKFTAVWEWMDRPVPFISIDQHGYNYIRALKEIKRRLEAGEKATMPEPARVTTLDKVGPAFTEEAFVAAVYCLCDNHVDALRVLSPVERIYDVKDGPMVRREARGPVDISFLYHDPYNKPLIRQRFRVSGESFREVLRDLALRLESARANGCLPPKKKGESDEQCAGGDAGTEGPAG